MRKRFLMLVALFVLTTMGLQVVVNLDGAPATSVVGPGRLESSSGPEANIVLLLVDDMRDDDLRFMPRTRRLLERRGVRFVNSFSPNPLCCPARASILSGLYTHNHRVFDITPPFGFRAFDDRSTIATWLSQAGYTNTLIGKYLNGYGWMRAHGARRGTSVRYVPPGWHSWHASLDGGVRGLSSRQGSNDLFNTTLSDNGTGVESYRGRYQTRVYGRLMEQTIRDRAPARQPFFLYASFSAPHYGPPLESDDPRPMRRADGEITNLRTPARPVDVRGRYDDIKAAPGASWRDPDIGDKPAYIRGEPPLNAAERRGVAELTRQRAQALSVVDQQIERILTALRQTGELDNTLIVFTSDNGYFLGEQRQRQGKNLPYEPSLRVPMLMRGPGIPAGQERRDPIMSIDLAPTLAAFAGVSPANPVDGQSMLEVARGGDHGWTRPVLTETRKMFHLVRRTNEAGRPLAEGGRRDIRFAIGIRTPRYLYVDLATGEKELYDLERDPREYHNLAGRPAYQSTQRLLAQVLRDMRSCDAAACRLPLPTALQSAG